MKHDPLSHLYHTITHIWNTKHISQIVTTNSNPETTQQSNAYNDLWKKAIHLLAWKNSFEQINDKFSLYSGTLHTFIPTLVYYASTPAYFPYSITVFKPVCSQACYL